MTLLQPDKIILRQLGLQPYAPVSQAMHNFTDSRTETTPDELWLVQHHPVFTQGQAGKAEHLLMPGDIPVGPERSRRPGDLPRAGPAGDVRDGRSETQQGRRAPIGYGDRRYGYQHPRPLPPRITRPSRCAWRVRGEQKICSLGLRIRKGSSFHGLALNVAMDLSPFQRINPCGYAGMQMTQVSALAPDVGIEDIHPILVQEFVHLLGYQTVELRNWNLHDYL